ncbi:hypothetical protein Pd630_LPD10081 (plasmid) [Rhodococcus opacus PD630]|nr:hypothetical protein Pd630_LPD10079 [Rhodococcus opacus PD630]AHK35531.1 hypothetical protein Pd630_LPD10081 [Rhodococcus opacus PD630]
MARLLIRCGGEVAEPQVGTSWTKRIGAGARQESATSDEKELMSA